MKSVYIIAILSVSAATISFYSFSSDKKQESVSEVVSQNTQSGQKYPSENQSDAGYNQQSHVGDPETYGTKTAQESLAKHSQNYPDKHATESTMIMGNFPPVYQVSEHKAESTNKVYAAETFIGNNSTTGGESGPSITSGYETAFHDTDDRHNNNTQATVVSATNSIAAADDAGSYSTGQKSEKSSPKIDCPKTLYMGGTAYGANILKKAGCPKPDNYNGPW